MANDGKIRSLGAFHHMEIFFFSKFQMEEEEKGKSETIVNSQPIESHNNTTTG